MEFIDDILVCPGCWAIEREPSVEGDSCICDETFVDGRVIQEWYAAWNRVGSIVAAARQQREAGGHHLAVYGAIGKCLIDMPDWNGHEAIHKAAEAAKGTE